MAQGRASRGLVRTAWPYETRPAPPDWIKELVESQRRALLLPVSAGWPLGWAQEQSGDPKPLELRRNRQTPFSQGSLPAAQQSSPRPTSFHQVSWEGFPITEPLHHHRSPHLPDPLLWRAGQRMRTWVQPDPGRTCSSLNPVDRRGPRQLSPSFLSAGLAGSSSFWTCLHTCQSHQPWLWT